MSTIVTTAPARTRNLAAAALICALIMAVAPLRFEIGAVPVTLQTFAVFLAALLLPAPWAGSSMALYVALGTIGLPVFSGGTGGAAVLAGPTGGYLLGFIIGAAAGAATREALTKRGASALVADIAGVAMVVVCVYALGVVQLSIVAGLGLPQALVAGTIPFAFVDIAKAAVAIAVAVAVRKAVPLG